MAEKISITVKLFSHLKYALEQGELILECEAGSKAEVIAEKVRGMGGAAVSDIPFRIAVNQNFVAEDHILKNGDEVVIMTPIEGG